MGLNAVCFVMLFAASFLAAETSRAQTADVGRFGMVIHGGAGTITPDGLDDERQEAYREKLEEALRAGYDVLSAGGSSLDAVVAAISVMEESPLFNSARGAVLTSEGTVELDASIMDGSDLSAGAVASVKHVKSPILLARTVMEESRHVMLVGEGAEAFAREQGLEMVSNDYFITPRRKEQFERYRERAQDETGSRGLSPYLEELKKFGTVGAAALDQDGNLAAGTSTGGISYKRWGRVGDSPIIGAGTYADNETCAISSTGAGEYFIRGVVAHDIASMIRYANRSLAEAAAEVIHRKLPEMGGTGGVIGIDTGGNVVMSFNTEGMFRGTIDEEGNVDVKMFGE